MNGQRETSAASPCKDSSDLAGPAYVVKLVTTMIGIVVGLTFLFGFVRHEALCFEWR